MYKTTRKQHHEWVRFPQKTGLSGFQYCWGCGLIALRNESTQKAVRKGCVVKEDFT